MCSTLLNSVADVALIRLEIWCAVNASVLSSCFTVGLPLDVTVNTESEDSNHKWCLKHQTLSKLCMFELPSCNFTWRGHHDSFEYIWRLAEWIITHPLQGIASKFTLDYKWSVCTQKSLMEKGLSVKICGHLRLVTGILIRVSNGTCIWATGVEVVVVGCIISPLKKE